MAGDSERVWGWRAGLGYKGFYSLLFFSRKKNKPKRNSTPRHPPNMHQHTPTQTIKNSQMKIQWSQMKADFVISGINLIISLLLLPDCVFCMCVCVCVICSTVDMFYFLNLLINIMQRAENKTKSNHHMVWSPFAVKSACVYTWN